MIRKVIRSGLCAVALFAAAPVFAADAKVPTTAEEHYALAKQYQEQATAHRKEAQQHREMAEAYKRTSVDARKGYGQRNPWVVKMEKHCATIAATADKLATEDEKAAEFHAFRGKELEGK
jgi:hypothetical protein